MKNHQQLQALIGDTDIYLIDQILKNRYEANDRILDAGCGTGRNMDWFLINNIPIYGVDSNEMAINELRFRNRLLSLDRLQIASVEQLPFSDHFFHHIISSAVLHFASSTAHFMQMMSEMVRVLQPNGSLFIRMTSNIGIEDSIVPICDGVYLIPDGSTRFLLTKALLHTAMKTLGLQFLEPLKTVNVDDMRCMSTIVLQKTTL